MNAVNNKSCCQGDCLTLSNIPIFNVTGMQWHVSVYIFGRVSLWSMFLLIKLILFIPARLTQIGQKYSLEYTGSSSG